ncbi:MAG: (d)CMP kinase [Bacteroidaceae bacterium]|nr:(d)CMP kinase [Bacteroidaceae bacterium]
MENQKGIIIAIDGHSSCGKSTMAKALAKRIGYTYIDTGAMYRAVTYYCISQNLIRNGRIDTESLQKKLPGLNISFITSEDGNQRTCLNSTDIEDQIRSMEVSAMVSPIAALPFVRSELVEKQRAMGNSKCIVMDGRDIGTTVFPNAELKIFVTASAEVRATRRYLEMKEKGGKIAYQDILDNVKERDRIDSTREVSPLRKADDAIILDNGNMTRDEQNGWLYKEYLKALERNGQ